MCFSSIDNKLLPEVEIQEYEDKTHKISLTYRHLNGIFFLLGITLATLYFCNEFLVDTLDMIDSIFFSIVLLLNLVINWMTKPKFLNKLSKKRIVNLLINFVYILSLLVGYTLGYILDKIEDCNLFTGAKDCHSDFTLFQYITVFLMFFILVLKLFF
jgi:hypothetical protein